jgi:hypothetical protein
VTTGFCPQIWTRFSTAASMAFGFDTASPRPMLMVIFWSFGTCIGLPSLKSFISAGTTSLA